VGGVEPGTAHQEAMVAAAKLLLRREAEFLLDGIRQ
jgi:hypothetical protein